MTSFWSRLFGRKQAAAVAKTRNYAGAQIGRLTSGWRTTPTPPNYHIWTGLQGLRTRSREQYRNNDYARRFVAMCRSNIVGPNGIVMQSKVADPDGKQDKLAQAAIEKGWREWSQRCDVAGRLNLIEMCRLIVSTTAVDGECLVQIFSDGDDGYRLKMIDPELLDIKLNEKRGDGVHIRMGVEVDRHGRPLAYHLLERGDDLYQASYYTGKHIRVPASEMLHLYLPEMIDQARGVPWMASALMRLKNLHGYEEAAVIAARIGASKMGFFTKTESGLGDAEALSDGEDAAGNLITDADPGTFEELPEGYNFQSFNPDYPHQQFPDFVKATLRGVASGLGVAYNGLANDLEGVNYSSIRAGVLEEREQWKSLQQWLIDGFMRPVFDGWLNAQLLRGSLTVPSKTGTPKALPPARFEKFRAVSFQPRRWAWVDPLKDMAANGRAIDLGLKSRSEIIRDMGRDPDEVWAEIQRENETMKAMGVEIDNSAVMGKRTLEADDETSE